MGILSRSILTAILMGVGGIIGYVIRSQLDELRQIREELRTEKREIYGDLLRPFAHMLSGSESDAIEQVTTPEYRFLRHLI